MDESAEILLQVMALIQRAALAGAPSAQPYLEADAIRIVDGEVHFHRDRFLNLLAQQIGDLTD